MCAGVSTSFAELDVRVDGVAGALRSRGVASGEQVALLAGNGLAFAVVLFALNRLGAVAVPLNVRLTAPEIAFQLSDSDVRHLIFSRAYRTLVGEFETSRTIDIDVLMAKAEVAADPLPRMGDWTWPPHTASSSLPAPADVPRGRCSRTATCFWNAAGSALHLGLHEDDRWLVCMPLFHVGGLSILVRGVLYGITTVVHESFDAARVARSLDEDGVTIASLVPTMLRRLLQERPQGSWPRLRFVLLGGGPVPADLVAECVRRGIPVAPTYGLSEAASQVATLPPGEVAARPGSAGKPLMTVELRVEGEDGGVCASGEPGEVVVRGPTVMSGYYKRPAETEPALRGGWLHTGDFGYLDDDGYLYVLDRRDDLIVTGGENVYSRRGRGRAGGAP